MGNVTFLGVEGSGKSVLTLALVNAFKAHQAEGFFLRSDTRESFRFFEQTPAVLGGDSLPSQTAAIKYLRWTIQYNRQDLRTFDTLDYPGEIYRLAFLDAADSANPAEDRAKVEAHKGEINELLHHLLDSDQVFVLFNLSDADDIAHNAANLDAVWITNACLGYLSRLPQKPKITLLLTQIDRYCDPGTQELDAKVFVARHLPLIHQNFPDLDVLAVSALGTPDSATGIDAIIERFCRDALSGKQHSQPYQDVLNWCSSFSEHPYDNADVLAKTASDNLNAPEALPWFCPQDEYSQFFFSSAEAQELQSLAKILSGSCQLKEVFVDERISGFTKIQQALKEEIICHPRAEKLRNVLLEEIGKVIKQQQQQREQEKKDNRVGCIILGIFIGSFLLFIIIAAIANK